MDETKYISSVKLPDGSVYKLKDVETRELLDDIFNDELIIDCGGVPPSIEDLIIIDCGGAPINITE